MIRAKDNPFATDRVERLLRFDPELAGTTWSEIHQRWNEMGRRGVVAGRHGSGKTTFLDAWKRQLERRGEATISIFLSRNQREPSDAQWRRIEHKATAFHAGRGGGEVLLIDGAEQLSRRSGRRLRDLLRGVPGWLETRHRAGSRPVLVALDPGPEVLARCVRRLSPRHGRAFAHDLPRWWKSYRGNLREILLHCYDEVVRTGESGRKPLHGVEADP